MSKRNSILLTILLTALAATLLFYFTPLKYIDLVTPPMNEIDPAAFWKEYQADPSQYIFFDVRPTSEYDADHAEGAISEPIEELTPDHLTLPRSGKTIVLTCSGDYLSTVAYGYLQDQGFSNLLRIKGGLRQWIVEGLPIESATSTATTSDAE